MCNEMLPKYNAVSGNGSQSEWIYIQMHIISSILSGGGGGGIEMRSRLFELIALTRSQHI